MKCPVCQSKKGKRSCLLTTTCICSLCCGNSRQFQTCQNCEFYKPPVRDYKRIPSYRPEEMDGYLEREKIANTIESAISTFDLKTKDTLSDEVPIRIIELLLDLFHFKDTHQPVKNEIIEAGFQFVLKSIQKELKKIPEQELIKILGAIYFVATRRTKGQRQYLNIIRQYVRFNVSNGMRVRSLT